jgi:nicotinamidase-related amidase
MKTDALTPENSTIVLIDYVVGFANLIGSHDLAEHINNAVGLAKTAVWYGSGLVAVTGRSSESSPRPYGPYYPELLEVLGDHPVIARGSGFNCFADPDFSQAVHDTGRQKLIFAGISGNGCVLQTVLGALRQGYEAYIVVDATGALTERGLETAVHRMILAGAVPLTWFSLAAEYQEDPRFAETDYRQRLIREHVPAMSMGARFFYAAAQTQQKLPAGAGDARELPLPERSTRTRGATDGHAYITEA